MFQKMRYRLALDLGSTSLGWAMVRLNARDEPNALIKAGVRIFSNGREPAAEGRVGESKAVARRQARGLRRRRDRLLKRKALMMRKLIAHGFFSSDEASRKAMEKQDPYELRAKGLNQALKPEEFARVLFHINQRRGFKSNRKSDRGAADSGPMKKAIGTVEQALCAIPRPPISNSEPFSKDAFDWLKWVSREASDTRNDKPRTVGEFLHQRFTDTSIPPKERKVRARNNGEIGAKLAYDLYIDRAMIQTEFEALWARQSEQNPTLFNDVAYGDLKDCLLYQRKLKPVLPGRCTLEPDEPRAPLALPSQQRFRIYQEVNNLRLLETGLTAPRDLTLSIKERNLIVDMLETPDKEKKSPHEVSFHRIRTVLGLGSNAKFTVEDAKRTSLKGNSTSASLSKVKHFGPAWFEWSERQQDAIVKQLVHQEDTSRLIRRLVKYCGVDALAAGHIAEAGLPEGYGSLSMKALNRILPKLREKVITYDKAVKEADFPHHSRLNAFEETPGRTFNTGFKYLDKSTGEIQHLHAFKELPYYGEFLKRHVGFADPKAQRDEPEKYFGKIANPTVHVGLNQVRVVVNALIKRYGHPSEVIVEVANELKRPADHRPTDFRSGPITKANVRRYCPCAGCVNVRQGINQDKNKELHASATKILGRAPSRHDMERMRIWNEMSEMSGGIVQCPYSGETIGASAALSAEIEVDHVFPHQKSLDDSLVNKVLCVRHANRIKKDRSPAQAKDDFLQQKGWKYEDILARVSNWDGSKRFRFQEGAFEKWLGEENSFAARALNDTRYLSKVAREYLSLICPQNTRVIPGKLTSELRHLFGLDEILGLSGKKNRNDHRHHAVDACVIAVTDQGMLQRFASASASARAKNSDRLLDTIEPPWPKYFDHVKRAVEQILVSHKPDHGYEGEMFDQTIYTPAGFSRSAAKIRSVIPFMARPKSSSVQRHVDSLGNPTAYKGLLSNSNYCIEIVFSGGAWVGEVIPTHQAYDVVKKFHVLHPCSAANDPYIELRSPLLGLSGKRLAMRLHIGDTIRIGSGCDTELLQVLKINSSGSVTFIRPNETNVPSRYTAKLKAQKLAAQGEPFDINALNDNFFQRAMNPSSLLEAKARRVTISPIGELRDPGFKE